MKKLIYYSKVDSSEESGQASFERGIRKALSELSENESGLTVCFIVPYTPSEANKIKQISRVTYKFLPQKRKKWWWFVLSELYGTYFLLLELLSFQRRAVFIRYHPTMITAPLMCKFTSTPYVFRTGPVFDSIKRFQRSLRPHERIAIGSLFKLFVKFSQKIVVAAKGAGEWVIENFPESRDRIVVIGNVADPEKLMPVVDSRANWGLSEEDFIVGFIGSFVEEQGVATVIEALSLLDEYAKNRTKLLLVGDGTARDSWLELAERKGVQDMVVWKGRRSYDEVPLAMSVCDVMVLPVTKEVLNGRGSSAIKLYEYLSCDKFILASTGSDFKFLADEGVGLLAEPDNPNAWARLIESIVANGVPQITGLSRQLVLNRFNYKEVAKKILNLCFGGQDVSKGALVQCVE